MSKTAVAAALFLALSFGAYSQSRAANLASGAFDDGAVKSTIICDSPQATTKSGLPTQFSAPQSTTNKVTYPGATPQGWQTNPVTGIGGPGVPAAKSTTTSTTTTADPSTTPGAPATTLGPGVPTTPISGFPGYPKAADTTKTGKTPAAPGAAKAATGKPKAKADESVTIAEGPPNAAKSSQWQKFNNYITLKSGQEQLNPLTLTVTDKAYTGIRLYLSGRQIASEKDFKDGVLTMPLAGALGPGDNQLLIQAYGPTGATLTWKVTTLRPVIVTANPDSVVPNVSVTLNGRNFGSSAATDSVTIGGKAAVITSASPTQIAVTVPGGLTKGDVPVVVSVVGNDSKPLKIKFTFIQAEMTSCDMYSAPSGYPVTISGKNFATKASDLSVTVNGMAARILSSTATSVQFEMPDIGSIIGPATVVIKSNGVEAKGHCEVLGSRPMPYDGTATGVTQ